MKLAISNIAWPAENDDAMYAFMMQQGFKGLEIAPTRLFSDPYSKPDAAGKFARMLEDSYNISIVSMQSICFGRDEQIFKNYKERDSLKEYIKQATDFASALNCPNMVFGSPKNRNIGADQYNDALNFFRELGEYAQSRNTFLAIEPNPEIYGTNFLNFTNDAVSFVKDAGCAGLKVNLDFGTILANNEDIDVIAQYMPYINHIHISEPFLEAVKERDEHVRLAGILKEAGYNNYLSIEMKNPGNIDGVKQAILYVKSIFK